MKRHSKLIAWPARSLYLCSKKSQTWEVGERNSDPKRALHLNLLPTEPDAFPGPPIRFGHECRKNAFGAQTSASTNWNYDYRSILAIREKTWSSGWVRLTRDNAILCVKEPTAQHCPQWIQVDFDKETAIYFVEFESWNLRSAPTKFRILGYPAHRNTANETEAKSGRVGCLIWQNIWQLFYKHNITC